YLELPFVSARMGVNDRIDVGLGYAQNYGANYGWLSADVKYAFMNTEEYAVAARLSFTSLLGVEDFNINQAAVDLLVSKKYNLFAPYAGVAAIFTTANETTSKVNLTRANYASLEPIV